MIGKVKVGVKYKLVDIAGFKAAYPRNKLLVEKYLEDDGCFTLHFGEDLKSGAVYIGNEEVISPDEFKYFTKYEEADKLVISPEIENAINSMSKEQLYGLIVRLVGITELLTQNGDTK